MAENDLPRLNDKLPVARPDTGLPSDYLLNRWDELCRSLESINAAQGGTNEAVAAALAAAGIALGAAATATAATAAQQKATALQGSYVTPANILSAADNGTGVTVTIANHTRMYADNTSVVINGSSLIVPYGDVAPVQYIYYDTLDRTISTVTFVATADSDVAAQIGDRHSVGAVSIPLAGGADTEGSGTRPPGFTRPDWNEA